MSRTQQVYFAYFVMTIINKACAQDISFFLLTERKRWSLCIYTAATKIKIPKTTITPTTVASIQFIKRHIHTDNNRVFCQSFWAKLCRNQWVSTFLPNAIKLILKDIAEHCVYFKRKVKLKPPKGYKVLVHYMCIVYAFFYPYIFCKNNPIHSRNCVYVYIMIKILLCAAFQSCSEEK